MKSIFTFILTVALLAVISNDASAQFWKKKKESVDTIFVSGLKGEQELARKIAAKYPVPTINYEPVVPEKFWKKGLLTQLGFSQTAFSNWAAGGSNQVALNSYVNAHLNYAKGNMYWENRAILTYGFIQSVDNGYRKSDDKIQIDSKFGYRAINDIFLSAAFNFTSQFSPGFKYPNDSTSTLVSQFMAPGYLTLGIGLDYKKGDKLSINFAPLTASAVVVTKPELRKSYGNAEDEEIRYSLGAQLTITNQYEFAKKLKLTSQLVLFSDYRNQPQNVRINWDFGADVQINKFFSTTLRTNLIYDDKVKIADSKGDSAPRLQFKEILSIGFSYTFGAFTK